MQGPWWRRLPGLAMEEERWNRSDGWTMGQVLVCSSQQEPLLLQRPGGCRIITLSTIAVLLLLLSVPCNSSSVVLLVLVMHLLTFIHS